MIAKPSVRPRIRTKAGGPASPPPRCATKAAETENTFEVFRDLDLEVEHVLIESIRPYGRNLRDHSPAYIEELKDSIQTFGMVQPLVIDAEGEIIGGGGLFKAACALGCKTVPVIRVRHLDAVQKRILRVALGKLAEKSKWHEKQIGLEFGELFKIERELGFDLKLDVTGFCFAQRDQLAEAALAKEDERQADDALPDDMPEVPVSQLGDVWLLDEHRLICGDARDMTVYESLLGDKRAAMGIHDAPYDVPISGNVAKPGKHREFVMGSGELGLNFIPFLTAFLTASTAFLVPGGYQFCFMDWRHMAEMLAAGEAAGLELKNLCVWNKCAGAMGSLYRSQHELVFVFKDKRGAGVNYVQLGRFGRNRTNVWDYPGAASLRKELKLHPTPKNVAMIADAIRDVTRRNDVVLDSFSGSGTTIIACAKVGRCAYAIELDRGYVDVGVRRWEDWSGSCARHATTGLTFAQMADLRLRLFATVPPDAQPTFKVRQRSRQVA